MNPANRGLSSVLARISNKLQQDWLVNDSIHELRNLLKVDRVVLYYFYSQWKGQVTFEALSDRQYSIICSTGPDECFNLEYAELYLGGRIKATDDIESGALADCHRDFLRNMQVKSNLVAPILTHGKLWGLLAAHHCQDVRLWQISDIDLMRKYAHDLADAPSIGIDPDRKYSLLRL